MACRRNACHAPLIAIILAQSNAYLCASATMHLVVLYMIEKTVPGKLLSKHVIASMTDGVTILKYFFVIKITNN